MTFEIVCRQCGKRFTDPNPHESYCSGRCFREWYIANRNPDWTPMKQPRRAKGGAALPFIFGLYEDDEDAA